MSQAEFTEANFPVANTHLFLKKVIFSHSLTCLFFHGRLVEKTDLGHMTKMPIYNHQAISRQGYAQIHT